MNMSVNNPLRPLVLALGSLLAGQVTAQTFTNLYDFSGGADGAGPRGVLVLSGNTLYGTSSGLLPGSSGGGTVFAINTEGTAFTALYYFNGGTDGANPQGDLVLSDDTLYGTAENGGLSGNGTMFAVNTDGTGLTNLYYFTALTSWYTNAGGLVAYTNSDGAHPIGGLILSGNTLYGTAEVGGSSGSGTVFAMNTNSTGFSVLHSFTAGDTNGFNGDGTLPDGLMKSGNTLYGAAWGGGTSGLGTVFRLSADGTAFRALHSFTGGVDGQNPNGGLLLTGNTLFGTTYGGGGPDAGTVFAVNADGTGFTTLHSFARPSLSAPYSNSGGSYPRAGLVLMGSTLYGTVSGGGSLGGGTVFAISTNGTGFSVLHNFSSPASPRGGLILSGNTLYGTTYVGGSFGYGTIFSISLPVTQPQLTITPAVAVVMLSWPTSSPGFTLQSSTNLASPLWATNLQAPVVVNGQYIVTNPISATRQFFRLSQ
jgi:uncharacterized repeat protein (TIGR03803 family)